MYRSILGSTRARIVPAATRAVYQSCSHNPRTSLPHDLLIGCDSCDHMALYRSNYTEVSRILVKPIK